MSPKSFCDIVCRTSSAARNPSPVGTTLATKRMAVLSTSELSATQERHAAQVAKRMKAAHSKKVSIAVHPKKGHHRGIGRAI